jgi:hypothetical protein
MERHNSRVKSAGVSGIFLLFTFASYSQTCELIWTDEFDYDGLPDPNKWSYDVGGDGWGNQGLQHYTQNREKNARVERVKDFQSVGRPIDSG